jgi:hypothetical protein
MLNQYDKFISDLKGNIVNSLHKKDIREGIDGNRNIGRQFDACNCPIQLPQSIGIAKKKRKNTVFIPGVDAHITSVDNYNTNFGDKEDYACGIQQSIP